MLFRYSVNICYSRWLWSQLASWPPFMCSTSTIGMRLRIRCPNFNAGCTWASCPNYCTWNAEANPIATKFREQNWSIATIVESNNNNSTSTTTPIWWDPQAIYWQTTTTIARLIIVTNNCIIIIIIITKQHRVESRRWFADAEQARIFQPAKTMRIKWSQFVAWVTTRSKMPF